MYSHPISIYAHTWYKPAPMNIIELRFRAMQRLINMYDAAIDDNNYQLIQLFDNELGFMSQEAQLKERNNECGC